MKTGINRLLISSIVLVVECSVFVWTFDCLLSTAKRLNWESAMMIIDLTLVDFLLCVLKNGYFVHLVFVVAEVS